MSLHGLDDDMIDVVMSATDVVEASSAAPTPTPPFDEKNPAKLKPMQSSGKRHQNGLVGPSAMYDDDDDSAGEEKVQSTYAHASPRQRARPGSRAVAVEIDSSSEDDEDDVGGDISMGNNSDFTGLRSQRNRTSMSLTGQLKPEATSRDSTSLASPAMHSFADGVVGQAVAGNKEAKHIEHGTPSSQRGTLVKHSSGSWQSATALPVSPTPSATTYKGVQSLSATPAQPSSGVKRHQGQPTPIVIDPALEEARPPPKPGRAYRTARKTGSIARGDTTTTTTTSSSSSLSSSQSSSTSPPLVGTKRAENTAQSRKSTSSSDFESDPEPAQDQQAAAAGSARPRASSTAVTRGRAIPHKLKVRSQKSSAAAAGKTQEKHQQGSSSKHLPKKLGPDNEKQSGQTQNQKQKQQQQGRADEERKTEKIASTASEPHASQVTAVRQQRRRRTSELNARLDSIVERLSRAGHSFKEPAASSLTPSNSKPGSDQSHFHDLNDTTEAEGGLMALAYRELAQSVADEPAVQERLRRHRKAMQAYREKQRRTWRSLWRPPIYPRRGLRKGYAYRTPLSYSGDEDDISAEADTGAREAKADDGERKIKHNQADNARQSETTTSLNKKKRASTSEASSPSINSTPSANAKRRKQDSVASSPSTSRRSNRTRKKK